MGGPENVEGETVVLAWDAFDFPLAKAKDGGKRDVDGLLSNSVFGGFSSRSSLRGMGAVVEGVVYTTSGLPPPRTR